MPIDEINGQSEGEVSFQTSKKTSNPFVQLPLYEAFDPKLRALKLLENPMNRARAQVT